MIWAGLGQKFMAAQQAGLKTQACQRNLSAIYTGRNQNSTNNKAWVLVAPCTHPCHSQPLFILKFCCYELILFPIHVILNPFYSQLNTFWTHDILKQLFKKLFKKIRNIQFISLPHFHLYSLLTVEGQVDRLPRASIYLQVSGIHPVNKFVMWLEFLFRKNLNQ